MKSKHYIHKVQKEDEIKSDLKTEIKKVKINTLKSFNELFCRNQLQLNKEPILNLRVMLLENNLKRFIACVDQQFADVQMFFSIYRTVTNLFP